MASALIKVPANAYQPKRVLYQWVSIDMIKSQAEVEEIMQDGKINYNKSNVNARPCPAYALEGVTKDNQRVRIVFGQCDLKTKVITVIDLETDWTCDCPGDDDKYKNKN